MQTERVYVELGKDSIIGGRAARPNRTGLRFGSGFSLVIIGAAIASFVS